MPHIPLLGVNAPSKKFDSIHELLPIKIEINRPVLILIILIFQCLDLLVVAHLLRQIFHLLNNQLRQYIELFALALLHIGQQLQVGA